MTLTAADLPPSLLHFPRDEYNAPEYTQPRHVDPTGSILAAGARRATRAWIALVRKRNRSMRMSWRCFVLAVLDKVSQLNSASYGKFSPAWPERDTVAQWRAMVRDFIDIAYDLAMAALPFRIIDPVPRDVVRSSVAQMMQWFHVEGNSYQPYPLNLRPRLDTAYLLGEFAQPAREPSRHRITHSAAHKHQSRDMGRSVGLSTDMARLHI
ncbi:hypothetical protein CC85DRAFT_287932 [Cutaneotrichosporon oleaginosum]|uniref:Uncharacterized protein n=1 Tax=Cutaneotrichosporon oleaginosum TaxID=879819 RepID=A0A0J0XG61_9TREE|nr:uncharacterized protein CC85DRAFT_287932 [Cutaneotrichosporon oleaginosum]KLT40047.1 hypothetical protein CC85DRAFT_287932 [Cutaneotrichosporon oleaginosum]TXT13811.1 hypothetical protein COLE_00004 [Cutaneotrichosporon oleaginosum]